jgi:hypothetical protein
MGRNRPESGGGIKRRRLLLGGGVLAGVAMVGGAIGLGGIADALASDEYDLLRGRWADIITGGAIDPTDPAYATVLSRLDGATNCLVHWNGIEPR